MVPMDTLVSVLLEPSRGSKKGRIFRALAEAGLVELLARDDATGDRFRSGTLMSTWTAKRSELLRSLAP
jgi:hypothetical protein